MFPKEIYIQRRDQLKDRVRSGLIFLPGNTESPMNYAANAYPFRQDSTFLYYFGLDQPGLAAVIDAEEGTECLFGDDPSLDDIVWTGPLPLLQDRGREVGVARTAPRGEMEKTLREAARKGRMIHCLPPYRPEHRVPSADPQSCSRPSPDLIRAVAAQRSVKSPEEIEQIEIALDITGRMQVAAMKMAKPGILEYEAVGTMEGIMVSSGVRPAFGPIFSAHGEIMHNPSSGNRLRGGDIVINDSGAESPFHYASDITRTIPIGGRFSARQREIYAIVLNAQEKAIVAAAPGVEWREVHRLAAVVLMEGLRSLGLVTGDPQEAVAASAHTLFFPTGVGHMMGLDVHDMESLGEDYVGYTDTIRRNPEFGWRYLRLAKLVEPGYVITVEPGIYFIPALIDRWRADGKHRQFIDYDKVEAYRHFGGIRIEDDILITKDGCRVLGPRIPKTIPEVEALASA
ncbi:MAG: aminopeptidase P family protein [Planctomycetes bacterium]|nr:aminopeptidase P family protein [Planctomycetota bacterium]